jgi:hypothetical protein
MASAMVSQFGNDNDEAYEGADVLRANRQGVVVANSLLGEADRSPVGW